MALIRACNSPDSVYVARQKCIHVSLFIHPRVVKQLGLKTKKLARPRKVKNVDRTLNRSREIMDAVTLLIKHNVMIPGRRAGRPDRPGQATQTKTRSTACEATRQKQYDESTFSARLAEALRQHGVAVRTTRTSLSMMSDITDQLARLASKTSKSSSDEDVLARHGLHSLERPPRR
jgi:hypothetical protein